ncbi:MAG: SIMPL domain-containing protein [Candidatus Nanoarchaeia archaeon]|nr:SIMPL domain-containing protein [Candidatus Nanoarchaeia archaeon]
MEIRGILSYIVIIGLVAAVVLTAAIRPNYSLNMQPARNVLTVSGESEITTSPDKAEIYLVVEKKSETADGARILNSEASNSVIASLKNAGIKKEDIETSSFSIYPEQRYDEDTEKYITTGYVVRHVIKATTYEVEGAGQLVDTAVKAGANSVENINFGLSIEKKQKVDKDALAKATELAKSRAESMADAAGVSLEKLISVEGGSSYVPYIYYGARMEMAMDSGAKTASTSIMPQTLEVRATSTLVYEIE